MMLVKREGELAGSADTFQNTGDRCDGQKNRAGATLRRSGPQTLQCAVYLCAGLSNYRLAWCVEPRVYHNTAPVMTPYATQTLTFTHIHTHDNNCVSF